MDDGTLRHGRATGCASVGAMRCERLPRSFNYVVQTHRLVSRPYSVHILVSRCRFNQGLFVGEASSLGGDSGDSGEQWEQVGAGEWGAAGGLRARDGSLAAAAAPRALQGQYRCLADNGVGPPLLKHVNITVHGTHSHFLLALSAGMISTLCIHVGPILPTNR